MMCEYCLHDPCIPGCPNYRPRHSGRVCQICGDAICIGEEYIENYIGYAAHLDCLHDINLLLKWLNIPIQKTEDLYE